MSVELPEARILAVQMNEELQGKRMRARMGPNMNGKGCPTCGAPIEKISHGGGQVYLCPK